MVFKAKEGLKVERTVADTQFKIAANNKIFCILSDSIYVRKIDAVIRELCCNAFDAHIEAKQNRKFQVTLPSEFKPEFRVRDFGAGLSEDDMQMYTTYGDSTKSGSNAYIGAFGIGAKSPFAYTNTFNVTSYSDGIAKAYSMFVENGVPRMTKLGEAPSGEPSGLEVFFPVALKDIGEFKSKAVEICALMAGSIEFEHVSDSWISELNAEIEKYKWQPAGYLGQGFMTSELTLDTKSLHDYLYIVQGNVKYEMSRYDVIELLKLALGVDYDRTVKLVKRDFYTSGYLRVPNGTFIPHPSRERLTFDDLTKSTIKSIFQKIYQHYVVDSVDSILNGARSYYDLHRRVQNVSKLVSSSPKIIDFSIPSQNITTGINMIRNYGEWQKFEFSCVQIKGNEAESFRFKTVPALSMYGSFIDRIYYTAKYPITVNYRRRVLKDYAQSNAKNAVIIAEEFSKASCVFSDVDKSDFIDIQALPKLSSEDLTSLSERRLRVTKEYVSYLEIFKDFKGNVHSDFTQESCAEILEKMLYCPVYWIGSNNRYEFNLGTARYRLKVKSGMQSVINSLDFFIDYIKDTQPIFEVESSRLLRVGIVIVPESHVFRNMLPELVCALQEGIRFTVNTFMNKAFFSTNGADRDELFKELAKNPELLFKLLSGKSGIEYKTFFEKWFAAGMPEFEIARRKKLPFQILPDKESNTLREYYYSEKNKCSLDVNGMYRLILRRGFPILDEYSIFGTNDKEVAKDLVDYIKFKSDRLTKSGN